LKNQLKRERLKIAAGKAMAVLLVVALSVGCGQKPSQQSKKDVTAENTAKREERETLQLSELAQDCSLMCVTDDSIFVADRYEDNGDYFNCIKQYSRQGEELQRYSLGEMEVEGISGELICYSEERDDENREILYIAPIEKEKKEERVILKKRKKIGESEFEGIYDLYVWKSHVYYISDGDGIYHYDAGTGERKCLVKFQKDDGGAFSVIGRDGGLGGRSADAEQKVFVTTDDACYLLDREKGRIEHVPALDQKLGSDSWSIYAARGDFVFMLLDNESGNSPERCICYDRKENRERSSFRREDLQKILQQQGFEKKEWSSPYIGVGNAYSYGSRLYLLMNLSWKEKVTAKSGPQKGKKVEVYKSREFLLSCPWENIQDLRYEKEISQWIQGHQEYEQTYVDFPSTSGKYYSYIGRVQEWTFYGDEILVSYQDKWKKEKTGARQVEHYQLKGMNLDTGEVRDIPEKDVLYQIFVLSEEQGLQETGMEACY